MAVNCSNWIPFLKFCHFLLRTLNEGVWQLHYLNMHKLLGYNLHEHFCSTSRNKKGANQALRYVMVEHGKEKETDVHKMSCYVGCYLLFLYERLRAIYYLFCIFFRCQRTVQWNQTMCYTWSANRPPQDSQLITTSLLWTWTRIRVLGLQAISYHPINRWVK